MQPKITALIVGAFLAASSTLGFADPSTLSPEAATGAGAGAGATPACTLDAAEVFERIGPSVVQVIAFAVDPFRVSGRASIESGTAFAIGDGYLATNVHVVVDARTVVIKTAAGIVGADVVGLDPLLDIALLRPHFTSSDMPPVQLAPDDAVRVGQPVYVIGYPMGLDLTITSGIVSGLGRFIPMNTTSWLSKFIQTDAPVSAGNSGGPLVDACGRVIGMVTLQMAHPRAENIGFAIPAATLSAILPELVENGEIARPWHGLYGQMVTPQFLDFLGAAAVSGNVQFKAGFLVETVEPGSAADRAGIRGGSIPLRWGLREVIIGGDIITAVNGVPILTMEHAYRAVQDLEIGDTVEVTVIRGGRKYDVAAAITRRPILPQDFEQYRRRRADQ